MKSFPIRTLLVTCLVAAPLAAGQLQRERVSADARWLVHVDVEGFLRSGFWSELVSRQPELDGSFELQMEELRREFGLDPTKDLRSVTLYGCGEDEEDVVVLVEATAAVDEALTRLSQQPGYALRSHAGLELHTFDGEGFVHVQPSADGGRLIAIGHDRESVVEAVQVLRSEAPSLASRGDRLAQAPLADSFFYAACTDGIPGIHEIDPDSHVAGLATGLVVDVGQTGEELYLRAEVQTATIDAALDLADVAQGFVALGKLALSSQELPDGLTGLLRSLRIETRGGSVWLDFRCGVTSLFDLIEELSDGESW